MDHVSHCLLLALKVKHLNFFYKYMNDADEMYHILPMGPLHLSIIHVNLTVFHQDDLFLTAPSVG